MWLLLSEAGATVWVAGLQRGARPSVPQMEVKHIIKVYRVRGGKERGEPREEI